MRSYTTIFWFMTLPVLGWMAYAFTNYSVVATYIARGNADDLLGPVRGVVYAAVFLLPVLVLLVMAIKPGFTPRLARLSLYMYAVAIVLTLIPPVPYGEPDQYWLVGESYVIPAEVSSPSNRRRFGELSLGFRIEYREWLSGELPLEGKDSIVFKTISEINCNSRENCWQNEGFTYYLLSHDKVTSFIDAAARVRFETIINQYRREP